MMINNIEVAMMDRRMRGLDIYIYIYIIIIIIIYIYIYIIIIIIIIIILNKCFIFIWFVTKKRV